jgi:hypothetical protein
MNHSRVLGLGLVLLSPLAAPPLRSQTAPIPAGIYRAGLKNIVIPPPTPGLPETGADYRVVMENTVPENNRLVAAFVQPDALNAIRAGASPALVQYALVEVPRRAEFTDITPDVFRQITGSVARQFGGDLSETMKDQQDALNRRLQSMTADPSAVTLEKPLQLGAFLSRPDACAFAMIMPISAHGNSARMAAGLIVVRVQNRVLFLYLYFNYKDESSVEWVRATSTEWADAVLKANQP